MKFDENQLETSKELIIKANIADPFNMAVFHHSALQTNKIHFPPFFFFFFFCDAARQNQQNDCAPIEATDQPGHPPSLIRVFAVRSMGSEGPKLSSCSQRRLIRLGGCAS